MTATLAPSPWPMLPGSLRAAPWHFGRFVVLGSEPGAPRALQWLLSRNCSISPRQLGLVYGALCAASLLIAGFFFIQGATLILAFAGLELLAVGAALLVFARHAADRETLTLVGRRLQVEQCYGRRVARTFETRGPGERRTSDPGLTPGPMTLMGFTTAIDDTHHMVFAARKLKRSHDPDKITTLKMGGKRWDQMTPTERRDMPSDYEAQVGQGSITLHSEEHLATTDKGIVMLRRLLRKEIEKVLAGGDPAGGIFDEAQQVIKVEGGTFFTRPDRAASPLG